MVAILMLLPRKDRDRRMVVHVNTGSEARPASSWMRSRPRLRQGSLQGGKWSFGETCETKCLFIACVTVGCVGTKRLAEVRHAQRGSKLTHPPHSDLGLSHLSCECVGCGDDPSRRNIVRSLSTGLLAPGDSFFVPPSVKVCVRHSGKSMAE